MIAQTNLRDETGGFESARRHLLPAMNKQRQRLMPHAKAQRRKAEGTLFSIFAPSRLCVRHSFTLFPVEQRTTCNSAAANTDRHATA